MKATIAHDEKVSIADYYTAKSIRNAIAAQLARRIHITDELIGAKERLNAATRDFQEEVRKAIDSQRGEY